MARCTALTPSWTNSLVRPSSARRSPRAAHVTGSSSTIKTAGGSTMAIDAPPPRLLRIDDSPWPRGSVRKAHPGQRSFTWPLVALGRGPDHGHAAAAEGDPIDDERELSGKARQRLIERRGDLILHLARGGPEVEVTRFQNELSVRRSRDDARPRRHLQRAERGLRRKLHPVAVDRDEKAADGHREIHALQVVGRRLGELGRREDDRGWLLRGRLRVRPAQGRAIG